MAKEKVKEKESIKDSIFCRGMEENCKHKCKTRKGGAACGGAIYGMGLIGALVYFFQHLGPSTAGNIVMAIIKSIVWPALFVYKFLELLKF